jgi:hypothetical protein
VPQVHDPIKRSAFLEGLTARVGTLGISGKGLEVAAQGSPLIGPIISTQPDPACFITLNSFTLEPIADDKMSFLQQLD